MFRVRDPDLLKTYSCKGLDKFHLNHNDLDQLILIVSFLTTRGPFSIQCFRRIEGGSVSLRGGGDD